MAAESGVPGPAGGRAGLLAGQTQGDAGAVHRLQVAAIRRRRRCLSTGVLGWAADTDRWGERKRESVRCEGGEGENEEEEKVLLQPPAALMKQEMCNTLECYISSRLVQTVPTWHDL